ncbi:MAG: PD40 domain-containing protein, partial [Saprospiraceae bacterium]|nr:PD40 domain-containing protein [Saprospiraceae bacterium]
PDISSDHITFVYANDIWIANRDGSDVRRLTSFSGQELHPRFSPDGSQIAFTGEYDGNKDVYVVPIMGGEPRRLIWHPSADLVRGWTPDGKRILFASSRDGVPYPTNKFYTVDLNGDFPQTLPLARAEEGDFNQDGNRIVFRKIEGWETEFRNYKGGQNLPLFIANLDGKSVESLPNDNTTDRNPVWIGETVYFLSDRDHAANVWAYRSDNRSLTQRTHFKEYDCKNLSAGAGMLIFENGGDLYTLNPVSDQEPLKLQINVEGDFPWVRPHWKDVASEIQSADLSATGKRAIFSARGDLFTVPAENGPIRNLTNSPGVADREPSWSPDGKWIAWFNDEEGEYQLYLMDQFGADKRKITLPSPTFYYTPAWSPDSKFLSFADANRTLWVTDVGAGTTTRIDDEGFAHPVRTIYPEWSPDSKWIAYTKRLTSEYNAIFIYSLDQKKSFQITDGMADCTSPAWDIGGKYLYLLASTNYALNVGWLDMSSIERTIRNGVYVVVLNNEFPSPLAAKSDDESTGEQESKKDTSKTVRIDFDRIGERILALDIPVRAYQAVIAGPENKFFLLRQDEYAAGLALELYDLKEKKLEAWQDKVNNIYVSGDHQKIMIQGSGSYAIVDAGSKPSPGQGSLSTRGMEMWIDPVSEWEQMFHEAWRFQRDYFYVRNVHGLDLDWVYKAYAPLVKYARHRSDLTYLLDILGGETSVGHSFTGGGAYPSIDRVPIGMLGADFEVSDDRYRIRKIYTGEHWNPGIKSPLSGPGIDARTGDYLIEVNGQNISADRNLYSYFDFTAGKQIRLLLNDRPTRDGARLVTVTPVSSEYQLRQIDWVESNRRKVDAWSNHQLAYVWLPNTGDQGYNNFNRYYFAQKDRSGAIIDDRFNQGGYAADYIVDLLARPLMGYFSNPIGEKQPFTSPGAGIWGPKIMLINEMAGSGGDYLPYMFKKRQVGTLVGTRTWGGLVGIWDVPNLIDGGYITAPRGGFFNTEGEWDVENKGIAPNVEVVEDAFTGEDVQLKRAVEIGLEQLKAQPLHLLPQPADPVRVSRPVKNK